MRRYLKPLPPFAVEALSFAFVGRDVQREDERSHIAVVEEAPEDVRLFFRVDGVVIFDFGQSPGYSGGEIEDDNDHSSRSKVARRQRKALRERRSKYMNAFLPCLYTGVKTQSWLCAPTDLYNYIQVSNCRKLHVSHDATEAADWELYSAPFRLQPITSRSSRTITLDEIRESVSLFRLSASHSRPMIYDLLEILYRAGYDCSQQNAQGSLALSWVVIEKCQNLLWKNFITEGYKKAAPHTKIGGARKKALLNGRDYKASIVSQMLSLSGIYTDDMLASINEVRSIRNHFMHNMIDVSSEQALRAVLIAMQMVERILGGHIFFGAGVSSWG